MTAAEVELLVEQVVSAWRPPGPGGGVRSHPAWHDLDAGGRREAFEATKAARLLEAALDPEGLSSTGRAVMDRIGRGARID
jgi:hypothetical protein